MARGIRHSPLDVLPLLRAFLDGDRRFDVGRLGASGLDRALRRGLGPLAAHVSAEAAVAPPSVRDALEAADLSARLVTSNLIDTAASVLKISRAAGCEPVVLKGCAAMGRYYPAPHLRVTGDLDLLVHPDEAHRVESELRRMGFIQRSLQPAAVYEDYHHSMPFWHPERGVWVEVHTELFPARSPLRRDPRFRRALEAHVVWGTVADEPCRMMGDELQFVYTAARWAEMLDRAHGIFPLLDLALILRGRGAALDWDRAAGLTRGSWAATALHLATGYLDRERLALAPAGVLERLRAEDPYANRIVHRALHRMITAFVVEGREPGALSTGRNLRTVWATLAGPSRPWRKAVALPLNLLFADEAGGFDGRLAIGRLRRAAGRAVTFRKSDGS